MSLKKLWGLGDPAALDPQILQRFEKEIQAFSILIDRVNVSLQYTAANSVATGHNPLAERRDAIMLEYQQALTSGGDAGKAVMDVLARTKALCGEATKLADSTRAAKSKWEQQTSALETVEQSVAQAGAGDDVRQTEQSLTKVKEAAKQRDYQAACDLLDTIAGNISAGNFGAASSDAPGGGERRYPLEGRLPNDPVVPLDPAALESWNNPLVKGDPRDLFTTDRMDEVVDMHFQGEGTPELNAAMKGVLFAQPGDDVSKHLAEIGRLRGLEPSIVKTQFERFQQLQGVSKQLETARGLPPDDVMTTRRDEYLQTRGSFLGNQSSLRFGQVVGEATGLDPAFAAMLNPTGGMVGPGMDVLAPADANSPVIWHGIFHDAGGYLLNYQNSGPGYTYLSDKQPDSGRHGSDPIQGQVEGISYWYERRQPDRSVLEDIYDLTEANAENKPLMYDAFVKHPIAKGEALVNELSDDSFSEVLELTSNARDFSRESVESLKNSTRDAADAVQEQIGEADQTLDEMAAKARELGVNEKLVAAAQAAIKTRLQNASSEVEVWAQGTSAAFDSAGEYVEDNLEAVDRWADDANAAAKQKTTEMATGLEEGIRGGVSDVTQGLMGSGAASWGVNTFVETKQDVEKLVEKTSKQIDAAKAKVNEFYGSAVDMIDKAKDRASQEFVGVKNDLIDKLSTVQKTASKVVDKIEQQIDQVANGLGETGQNIVDATTGIGDSLADAVSGGTDTLAHSLSSATDFAAGSLDRLTNLLG